MIWFVVIGEGGEVLRAGQCERQDAAIQGEFVLTFSADPGITDRTRFLNGELTEVGNG